MTTRSPIGILFVPFHDGIVPANTTLRKWKRQAVWANTLRNRLIADLADGFAKTPRKTLRINGVDADNVKFSTRTRQRVVVLAETAEHAWRLEKMLPRWPVLDAMPKGERVVLNAVEPGTELDEQPSGHIATLVYAARYGITCDILVRATAGTGKLSWASIRGGGNKKGTTPVLLVDVQDLGSERERANAVIRRREYLEQGLLLLKATKGALRNT